MSIYARSALARRQGHPSFSGAPGRRLLLAVAPVVLLLLIAAGSARATVGEGGNCASAHMYVVAHEDDTLLFQSPSILQDIESGRCTRSVFITAGDAGKGPLYWQSREEGVEAAYAQMAGVANEWTSSTVVANGHPLLLRTLVGDPRVSAVFMRLPDGDYPSGLGYPVNGNQSLMKLWNGGNKATPSIASITAVDKSNSFTYADLVTTLTALMNAYEPQQVATQDYTETFAGWDHHDHTAAAYFVRLAQGTYAKAHQLLAFQDYQTLERPQNVFDDLLAEKKSVFYLYGLYDEGACAEEIACEATEYNTWLKRQYVTAKQTTGVVAIAGYAQTVKATQVVHLDGSASSDQSGNPLAYKWVQTGGPAVSLSGATTASPSFVAPASGVLSFALTVRDGVTASAADSVTVNVEAAKPAPVAVAGAPQTAASGATVQLDGSGSYDPEGQSLAYKWTQTAGPSVSLSSTTAAKPTFTAPAGPANLTFSLTVAAGGRTSEAATVAVEVVGAASSSNVAPQATASASSEAPEQGPELAIDGIVSGYPANPFAEWSSNGEKAGAWLNLKWAKAFTLDHVVLYDRPNSDDQITAGTLTFSDGSSVNFGALPNAGTTGLTVSFSPRATTSLKVTATTVSGTTLNAGLSEIEAWGSAVEALPTAVAGSAQTVASGATVQLDGSASSDPEGEPLSYKWTQTAGPSVSLSSTTAAKPTFTAPAGPASLTFSLTVAAGSRISAPATVQVEVAAVVGSANVAPEATATASSAAPEQGPELAVDGVVSGYPEDPFAEWSSNGEKAGAWLNLAWARPFTLDHVVLYDRPNSDDQITAGTLTFSDGSSVNFGALPNAGTTGLTVSFSPRATTSLKVTATTVSGTTLNTGLSELEAWGSEASAAVAPAITSGSSSTFTTGSQGSFDVTSNGNPTAALKATGTLPSGVSFVDNGNGTARLAGTPAASAAPAGSSKAYPLTVTASNSAGSVSQTFTLTVVNNEPKPTKPAFTTPSSRTAKLNRAVEIPIRATGVPTPTLTLSGSLPRGLSFKALTGGEATITGKPTQTGTFRPTITAKNSAGSTTQTLTLTVSR